MLAKTLEDVNTNVPIEVIDIDDNSELAKEYGIRGVPAMVMLDGNIEVKRLVGLSQKKELENWLNG